MKKEINLYKYILRKRQCKPKNIIYFKVLAIKYSQASKNLKVVNAEIAIC